MKLREQLDVTFFPNFTREAHHARAHAKKLLKPLLGLKTASQSKEPES